ncbi:MAG: haloacid dehalogenase-like hydrolase [Bacteroidales bacterium]|nr:haloacid dehalogenase-like hydrolase [Bacteroidales bacterium]
MKKKPIVALIYDFDGTLAPGNMQEFGLIQALGHSPEEFWAESNAIAERQDASNVLSYLKLILDEAGKRGISLRREDLRRYGRDVKLFDGVREWFGLINDYGDEHGVTVEHYISSSGQTEILEGTPIAHEFKKIFACSFIYNAEGEAVWPAAVADYTGKTQFLFKISKGILSIQDNTLVNESQLDEDKRIPFTNMIYFGDGETDVPSMKIVQMFGGNSIAVYNPGIRHKFETACKLLRQKRVNFMTPTIYTKDSKTYRIVCSIIDRIRADYDLKSLSKSL